MAASKTLGAFALSVAGLATIAADWPHLTPEELAKQSDLILLGECLGHDSVQLGSEGPPQNIAVIRVDSVFKGDPMRRFALLLLPPTRPGGLVASGDVEVEKGQRGLWYLKKRAAGLYVVDRPDRFIPEAAAEPRIRSLKQKP